MSPRRRAGADDVDVPVQAQPPWDAARERRCQPPQLVARRLLARVIRVRAQGGEVVRVQVGRQAAGGGQLGQRREHRPLVAGDARYAQDRGRVAGERGGIDGGERSGLRLHRRHAIWPIDVVSPAPRLHLDDRRGSSGPVVPTIAACQRK